jgi:hypothetical protein
VLTAIYALVLLAAAAEIVRSLHRSHLVVFQGYVTLGEATLLRSSDPYLLHLNTWPPFFLFVAAGLALLARLSEVLALGLWQIGGALAIWGCCKLSAELFLGRGEHVTFWPHDSSRSAFGSSMVVVPFLMTARLFQEHLQHTQINIQVLFFVLLAFHLFRRGLSALGGAALALAASVKAVPILLLPYLAYKRAWRPLAWTAGFLVMANAVLPAAGFGPRQAVAHWRSWRAVAEREIRDPTPGLLNQSLLAALKRLVTAEGGARDPVQYSVATLRPPVVRGAFYVLACAAVLGLAWAFRRHPPGLDDHRTASELAILLGAMVVVDPLAWKAHYVVLIVPYTFAWWALRRLPVDSPGRAWRWTLWWGSFACITLSAPTIVGRHARDVLESFNVILVGALMVLVLAISLVNAQTQQAHRETPSGSASP